MKKGSFIDRIVKKDFNDELETVLEQKSFDENVKSILLNILYKIETAYQDMKIVKSDVESKDEYIEKLILIIKENCSLIKLIRMESENSKIHENSTFYINKNKGVIECYPIERKLLYAIWKLSKRDVIIKEKYYLKDIVLSDLINVGNTIQKVEPLRDFNGYLWTTLNYEIESMAHNLCYQNLRILIGNDFLEKWIYTNERIIDYYSEFVEKLKSDFGKKNEKKFVELIVKIAIILELKFDKNRLESFFDDKKIIEHELSVMNDKQAYVEDITNKKIELLKKIKNIDTSLSNKKLLQEEYIKRNENLPLDKKIFSMRVLSNMMLEERESYYAKIDELNSILKPKNFVAHAKELEEKYHYLKYLDIKDIQYELEKSLIQLQRVFWECFQIKINNAANKQDIISLMYQFRYYLLIPFDIKSNVFDKVFVNKNINNILIDTIMKLLDKAKELKAITLISKNKEYEYKIWIEIFKLRVIKLEDLSFKLIKEKDKFFMQVFDEGAFEEKIEIFNNSIKSKDLGIKLNKKIKLFE